MGTTEGLKRGLNAKNTKAPISVPVGEPTLGKNYECSWRSHRYEGGHSNQRETTNP